jgi:ribosomal-protein-alanine N-acetyltransferase
MLKKMTKNSQNKISVYIRWMIRRDIPEALAIERESFEFAWCEEDFIHCLKKRNCIGMVAEHGEQIIGFMIYEVHKAKLHILNFAVAKNYRMRGIGTQMIEELVTKLSDKRRTNITLEIRETNLDAQLFFKHMDFKAVSVIQDYYEDSSEDAYLMRYTNHNQLYLF